MYLGGYAGADPDAPFRAWSDDGGQAAGDRGSQVRLADRMGALRVGDWPSAMFARHRAVDTLTREAIGNA
jgi:hypothetical protein